MSANPKLSAHYLTDRAVRDPVYEFAQDAYGAADAEELDAVMKRHLSRLGLGLYAFYVATDRFKRPNVKRISGAPHAGWRKHYDTNRLGRVDELLKSGLTSSEPTTWSRFRAERRLTRQQENIYHQAADFGLRDGFFLPLHQPDGSMLGITMTVPASMPTDHGTLAILHMISLYYSMAATRLGMVAAALNVERQEDAKLSPRQIECLQWIAEGKSGWEISQILNLSEHTVNEHLAAARRRMGVRTTTQAVAHAVLRGIVRI